jgi:uncharacterized protein YhhL (DUF1145 family)
MSTAKMILLASYAVLAGLALFMGDTQAGIWGLRILMILAVVHMVEVVVFFKTCQRAGGSVPGHLLNVFLFGVIHVREIKVVAPAS